MSPCPGHTGGWRSPRAEGTGHGMPRMPTLPRDRGSEVGQQLPLRGHVVQPAAPWQWGRGPAPAPTPLLRPPWWAGSPGGPQPAPGGRGAGPQLLRHVPGLQPEREGTTAATGHLGGERGALYPPLAGVQQGGLVRTPGPTKAGQPAGRGSAASLLQGRRGGPHCSGRGRGGPSRRQVVGRLGGALGPLDDGRALLPPQQLVVLEEALVAGHPVGAVGEGQET